MKLYNLILVLVAVVYCECKAVPPFLHPATFPKYYEHGLEKTKGFDEARGIFGFAMTFMQYDNDTEQKIMSQLDGDEKKIYGDLYEGFYCASGWLNGKNAVCDKKSSDKYLEQLKVYIATNNVNIKKLFKKLATIYHESPEVIQETVYVSEVQDILNVYAAIFKDYPSTVETEIISKFDANERKLIEDTATITNKFAMDSSNFKYINTYVEFLKKYKYEIKNLSEKIQNIIRNQIRAAQH